MLKLNGNKIKWKYLLEFYEYDKDSEVRYAPKLTNEHFDPPFNRKMKVSLVAQVLIHTVAAGIYTLVRRKILPEEAIHTARFVKSIDSIFNLMNSATRYSNKPNGNAFTDESLSYLEESIEMFYKLKPTTRKELPCIMDGYYH